MARRHGPPEGSLAQKSLLRDGPLDGHLNSRDPNAYLVAIMDWHSRAVLAWEISNTMDSTSSLWTLHRRDLHRPRALVVSVVSVVSAFSLVSHPQFISHAIGRKLGRPEPEPPYLFTYY